MSTTDGNVVERIRRLFAERGDSMYGGEDVTQLQHALQAAHLAEQAGGSAATIAAALLHDVGHLLHNLDDDAPDQGVDDVHEELADRFLKNYFPAEVTEPVRLHVDAKRYLCTVDDTYYDQLSEPSQVSYKLQGGRLSDQERESFEQHPQFEQVVQVRRYDDLAKDVEMVTPDVEHFLTYVEQSLCGKSIAEATP